MAGTQAAKYCSYNAYGLVVVSQVENKKAASPQPTLKSMPLKNCCYQKVEKRAQKKPISSRLAYRDISSFIPVVAVNATPICST